MEFGWQYRNSPCVELPSFYSASVQVFQHGVSPYNRDVLQSLMGREIHVFPYLYPPPSLLFFYPLFVDENLSRQLTYAAAGMIAAMSGIAVMRAARIHAMSLDRMMLVTLPAMYLLAPFSWEHHLVYLLPSILMRLASRSRLPRAATILFYSAGIGSSLLFSLPGVLRLKFYGVVVLWTLCIFTACSKRIQLLSDEMEIEHAP